jgi:NAD-dependent deacetylase
MTDFEQLIGRLRRSTMVAFTGAGLSTAAGIPDYRGPEGVWTKNPAAAKLSRVSQYRDDSNLRRQIWHDRLTNPLYRATPTPGHRHLDAIARNGQLLGIVTQNVDGLHRIEDITPYPLIELHGCIHETRCLNCGETQPMPQALSRVANGDLDPRCQARASTGVCNGILTSNTVTFGEPVPPTRIDQAKALIAQADALLVIGSTLSVNPAARLVAYALEIASTVVVINQGPTRYDDRGVIKYNADCQHFLGALAALAVH